jgi:hypothetical protein
MARASPAVTSVADLRGLWRRSLLESPDGRRDTTTQVRWLQGVRLFADLRQLPAAAGLSRARCWNDLSLRDCTLMAQREGFAGSLACEGRFFQWARHIDFQPTSSCVGGKLSSGRERRMHLTYDGMNRAIPQSEYSCGYR